MVRRFGYIVFALAMIAALPLGAQTGQYSVAEEALDGLTMQTPDSGREFRAVAPFRRNEFLAASYSLDGPTTTAALHLVSADGRIGAPIPLPVPPNYSGSRIDGLVAVGTAVIGIGHVASGPEDRRGWIVRIEPDLTISATAVLPLSASRQPINYYYGGVIDDQGRLVVAGRIDQPDFPGIGVRFEPLPNSRIQIAMVFPNSAGSEAGLRVGDVPVRANGRDLRQLTPQQFIAQLAGPIDAPLDLVVERPGVGQRTFRLTRKMVRGTTTGAIAALDPQTLDLIQPPKPVIHATSRAGLQDIGRMRNGQLVGVGWWETFGSDGRAYDKAWVVGFNASLDPQSDQQFGLGGDNSIAQRVHLRPDGRLVVVGGLNARPEPVAFASELSMDGAGNAPARLTPLREHAVGPGRTDVFRGVATLSDGSTIVSGAFRSDASPRFQASAMVLDGTAPPEPLFDGCAQSYVWDMASNARDAIAIVGYCHDAEGERRAALMWSPPLRAEAEAVALASAPRVPLSPDAGGQVFDLQQPDSVLVFVPPGVSGVLSLTDAAGQLVDFASVDAGKAGLISAQLEPGRYVVNWASEGSDGTPRIDVLKATLSGSEVGGNSDNPLPFEMEKALALLGYSAVAEEEHASYGPHSTALTRELAAFQLSRNLPAVGHLNIATEVALSFDGALKSEIEARQAAELALRLAGRPDADTLPSRFGPVKGHWRGDAFSGAAALNSLAYSGEWQLGDGEQLVPSGFGVLDNLTSSETRVGMFANGVLSGLGVTEISRDRPTRLVGIFDDLGRFTMGAVMEGGTMVASGLFAPGGRSLVQEVPLSR